MAWKKIAWPKEIGGWVVKNPHHFTKAIETNGAWRILKGKGLWVNVIYKYIHPITIEKWFRVRDKHRRNVLTFHYVESIDIGI